MDFKEEALGFFTGFQALAGHGSQAVLLKIARKDTTIFFNRYYFIEKLTPADAKNIVSRR